MSSSSSGSDAPATSGGQPDSPPARRPSDRPIDSDHPRWPWPRIVAWAVTTAVVVTVVGPTYARGFLPPPGAYTDFVQEWLSARNFFTGAPIYRDVPSSLWEHENSRGAPAGIGPDRPPATIAFTVPETGELIAEMKYNAHPPVAVMLALPFAWLDYPHAHLAWNIVTFGLFLAAIAVVVRDLGIPFPWPAVFPMVILLLGNPVLNQIYQGQLNCVLAALVAAAWVADRRGRPALAGVAVGLAGAVKLYPLFLLAYFAFTRRWTGLAAGAAAFLAANGLAAALFGIGAYRDYFGEVVPTIAGQFQTDWQNISLTGFWLRLFETAPLRQWVGPDSANAVGQVFAKGLSLVVVGLVVLACWRAGDVAGRDRAFALAVVGMVLVSPITWGHYCLILLPPLALVWASTTGPRLALACAVVAVFWLPPNFAAQVGVGKEGAIGLVNDSYRKRLTTAHDLSMLSVPHYALLALFLLVHWLPAARSLDPGSLPTPG